MSRLAQIILTAWAGSLWTVCGLVVPLLFVTLDRQLAGDVATHLFYVETWLAAFLGALYIVIQFKLSATNKRFVLLLAAAAGSAPIIFYVVLRPMMATARAAGDTSKFASLHSASSALFLIACVATLILVWRSEIVTHPAK